MTGKTRGIGSVLAVLAAAAFVQAAERVTDDAKPSPAASGKAASPAETYEDAHPIPVPSGGCCGGPKLVPVCRCVPTTKKKPKTEYEVECELVCVPGCGKHLFGKRHSGCSNGDECCDHSCCDHAKIRRKKTLLKKVVDKEEDAWEYKVEWVCANCDSGCCPDGCSAGVLPPPGQPWHGFHEFWRGLFHRK
jgi:hypothetical protein